MGQMTLTDVLHLVGSFITVIVFMTGSSSLPSLIGEQSTTTAVPETLNTGILDFYKIEMQITIVQIATPLFNFFDTWFAISLARTFFTLLSAIGVPIQPMRMEGTSGVYTDSPIFRVYLVKRLWDEITLGIPGTAFFISVLVILPAVVGVNLAFQFILFAEIAKLFPILLVIASTLVTAALYRQWIRRLLVPVLISDELDTVSPTVDPLPLSISGRNPGSGYLNSAVTMEVFGTGLTSRTLFRLENGVNALGGSILRVSEFSLVVEFFIPETSTVGEWDVVLINPDQQRTVRLENAFEVMPPFISEDSDIAI